MHRKLMYFLYNLHVYAYMHSIHKETITADINRWAEVLHWQGDAIKNLKKLLYCKPEFRNLFYYRLQSKFVRILSLIAKPISTLFIWTENIGPGLFIQHGFATVIAAKSIGKNAWINQQVTIGYKDDTASPIIGDNVSICAGAIILGDILVGNDSTIGANAVVTKNVPEKTVIIGSKAFIIKKTEKKFTYLYRIVKNKLDYEININILTT